MRIVLAGAGYTNIEAASYIKSKLPDVTVTLISRRRYHSLNSHLPELLSHRRIEHLQVNIARSCRRAGVEFIQAEITHIDTHARLVVAGGVTIPYDYLLLDLGSESDDNAPGLQRALHVRDAHSYLQLRQHVVTEMLKARNTNRAKHKTFVVQGEGVTAIEVATELNALTSQLCEQHMLFREEIAIVLVNDGQRWPQPVQQRIESVLEEQGIEIYHAPIRAYRDDGVELPDRIIETGTLVWTKRKNHHLLDELGLPVDPQGSLIVDNYLRTADERVFAAGDNAAVFSGHMPVPKTAFMGFDEQRALAGNIIASVQGKPLHPYTPRKRIPVVITTGEQKALLIWGTLSWHGRCPYRLKSWISERYARRVGTE